MTAPDQRALRDAIVTPDMPAPPGLSDGHARPAGRRFSVYRNNVTVSLTDALRSGFPAIASLIGDDNFAFMAKAYAKNYPPGSPLLMLYGATFPAFLERSKPLSHIGYLGDVARLEHALRRSYHAADSDAMPVRIMQDIPLNSLMNASVGISAATVLLRSAWPVHSIWAYALDPGNPKPQAIPQNVLITRPEFDPMVAPLPAGSADFIDALIRGRTLARAHSDAMATTPAFDLAATLSLLLNGGAIIEINMKSDNE